MQDKILLKEHYFCFNKQDNGGESFSIHTQMIWNGDPDGIYYNQKLVLQSNCNSASFDLYGTTLTPNLLRQLANELEKLEIEAKIETRTTSK